MAHDQVALILSHIFAILLCLVANEVMLRRHGYPKGVLQTWGFVLYTLLLLYIVRFVHVRSPESATFADSLEIVLSNVNNVALCLMSIQVRTIARSNPPEMGKRYRGYSIVVATTILLVLLGILARAAGGQEVAFVLLAIARLLTALFSAYSLMLVGHAFGKTLPRLRRLTPTVFGFYAVYQLPYGLLAFFESVRSEHGLALETSYMNLSVVLKVACTFLVFAAASEFVRLERIAVADVSSWTDSPVGRSRAVGSASQLAPSAVLFLSLSTPGLAEDVRKRVEEEGIKHVTVVQDSAVRGALNLESLNEVTRARYGVVVIDRMPRTPEFWGYVRAFLGTGREAVFIAEKSIELPKGTQLPERFSVLPVGDIPASVGSWLDEAQAWPSAHWLRSITKHHRRVSA